MASSPSAAKWNILGTNDASFNDGTGIFGLYKNLLAVDSNPYKFRVSRNAAANTGNGAFAKITFDTEQYDTNSNFASGTYTAPVAGFYFFCYRAKWASAGIAQFQGALYKNGSAISLGTNLQTSGVEHCTVDGSDVLQLAANDTIDVYVANSATAALEVGATACYFSGFLISRT